MTKGEDLTLLSYDGTVETTQRRRIHPSKKGTKRPLIDSVKYPFLFSVKIRGSG